MNKNRLFYTGNINSIIRKKYFYRFFIAVICTILTAAQVCFSQELMKDELVEATLKGKVFENPYKPYQYNYENTTSIPVRLSVISDINSEQDIHEGQDVVFVVKNDVYHKGHRIIKKGDFVYAKVNTIIKSGMNGIPASIVFGDFKFNGLESAKFTGTYEKFGQDRSLWVYPLKWALTPLPPTGTLTNFIKGGHAKLKSREIFEIYYHPGW